MRGVVLGSWSSPAVFLSRCRNFVNFGNGSSLRRCASLANLASNYECMEEATSLELSGFELSFYRESSVSTADSARLHLVIFFFI